MGNVNFKNSCFFGMVGWSVNGLHYRACLFPLDVFLRYEVYVEEQGGDSAKIRWRASRVVPAQALVERKLQLSQ